MTALPPISPAPTQAEWTTVLASPSAQALPWVQAAAAQGNADAQAVLGQWLLDGHGMERNPTRPCTGFYKLPHKATRWA